MTIMQWNTARQGVDYRIGPRGPRWRNFTFRLPLRLPRETEGTHSLNYQLLVKSVADFLKVPADESEIDGK